MLISLNQILRSLENYRKWMKAFFTAFLFQIREAFFTMQSNSRRLANKKKQQINNNRLFQNKSQKEKYDSARIYSNTLTHIYTGWSESFVSLYISHKQ